MPFASRIYYYFEVLALHKKMGGKCLHPSDDVQRCPLIFLHGCIRSTFPFRAREQIFGKSHTIFCQPRNSGPERILWDTIVTFHFLNKPEEDVTASKVSSTEAEHQPDEDGTSTASSSSIRDVSRARFLPSKIRTDPLSIHCECILIWLGWILPGWCEQRHVSLQPWRRRSRVVV